jgi:hypothetical protein
VPIASRPTGYNLPWDDCLIPIAPNYFAIEFAIFQAAMAGCETIWVICDPTTVPLVRKRIGDFIYDPATVGSKRLSWMPDKHRRLIPIFYVPIPEKESYKSSCLPWSIIRGAKTAHEVCGEISKWTAPSRYFVSFPYGIYDLKELRPYRRRISSKNNFTLTHQGDTVFTGNHMSFTFDPDTYQHFFDNFKEYENEMSNLGEDPYLHFTNDVELAIIYKNLKQDDTEYFEPSWFYQIDTWDGYRAYLGSDEAENLDYPGALFLSYSEWNPIAEEIEE